MIRLNKLTDYAIVLLAQMAKDPVLRLSSSQLAATTGIPEMTVAKILKSLSAAKLVSATRGAQGGYRLEYASDEITIRAIIEALDGPIAITDCIGGTTGCCSAEAKCPVRGRWDKVNDAMIRALDGITLVDMIQPSVPPKMYGIK